MNTQYHKIVTIIVGFLWFSGTPFARAAAVPIPGKIPFADVHQDRKRVTFTIQVDRPGWFDVACRFRAWANLSLLLDGQQVGEKRWLGPGDYYTGLGLLGDHFPSAFTNPGDTGIRDVNCFPQVLIATGEHRIDLEGTILSENTLPPVSQNILTQLEFIRVPAALRAEIIVTGGGTNDGPLAKAGFVPPLALAADTNGNVYIAEQRSGRVRRLGHGENVETIYQAEPGTPLVFSTLSADGAGNCYFRSTKPNELIQIRTDKSLHSISLPIGEPLSRCPWRDGLICDQQTLPFNTIPDVQVALNGRVRYLRRLQLDATFISPFSLVPYTVLHTEVAEVGASNTAVVLSKYLQAQDVNKFRDPYWAWYGTSALALFPSIDSEPLVEIALINRVGGAKGPETHLLLGAEIPEGTGSGDSLAWIGPDQCYLARGGRIRLVIRQIARVVYQGPIESLATGPDGTLLASDGVQLLRLRPE